MFNFKYRTINFLFFLLIIILFSIIIIALNIGRYEFLSPITVFKVIFNVFLPDYFDVDSTITTIVIQLRLPRIIGALLVGSALSLSGATYQSVFQNPLVSPDLLGVSLGACVGAALAIIFGFSLFGIQILSFSVAIFTVMLTLSIPRILGENSKIILILSGIIIGGFMSSILGITKYLADPETQLQDLVYWMLGSISRINYSNIKVSSIVIISTIIILIKMRWHINILALGEKEALSLGVNFKRDRNIIIILTTLLTASAVCISGTIGWIGLVIPHLARKLVGNDNRIVFPITLLLGCIFMLIVDTISRSLIQSEIPLGIITGIIGAPLFIFMLYKEKLIR